MKKERKELYKKAIERWGNALQICMAIEEMSELTKELVKFFRRKSDFNKIAEEIADVKIMLEQLQIMFDNEAKVEIQEYIKLKRLSSMLYEPTIKWNKEKSFGEMKK